MTDKTTTLKLGARMSVTTPAGLSLLATVIRLREKGKLTKKLRAVPNPVLVTDAAHPELLRKNDHQSDAAFCWFACQALGSEWGLLSKNPPENGYQWPNGVWTSHDAIINRSTQEIYDIIASAGNGQATSPGWIGPQPKRPSNNWLALSSVPAPGGVNPPPPPPPPPVGDRCPDPAAHRPIPYVGDHEADPMGETIFADYRRAGQEPNPGMARWFLRTAWDVGAGDETGRRLSISESVRKHRNEWLEVLGLPRGRAKKKKRST
jgi:hypothetical protein